MERSQTPESAAVLGSNNGGIWSRILLSAARWLGNGISGLQTKTWYISFCICWIGQIQDAVLGYDIYPCHPEYACDGCDINLVVTFVTAIAFAILLNEIASKGGKKVVQTISYLPHFLSWIIVTGILHDMLSGTGIVNEFLVNMHIIDQPINFFAHTGYFWPIVAFANVWKETGWNAIIYLAAITSIDPSLYEAASIDGAGRWAKIKYVTLPGIKPTIIILLLMNVGNVLNAGFEIQYLLGNGLIQKVSQTIDIYVLKWGISQGDYAIGTAAGIFKSVVSIILIFIANKIAKHNGEEQLF